jgi:predicted RNA-binding protein with RPS1 domain
LRNDFISKKTRWGFLKQSKDSYSVKDLDTHLFFRLQVVEYECNLKEVYEDHIDKLIPYQITFFSSDNKIRCINLNRQLLPECRFLVAGNTTEGIVKNRVNGGYQIEIYTTILGFLPNSFVVQSNKTLQIGDVVQVTCVPPHTDADIALLDLTDNYNAKIRAKKEKDEFFERLKPGDAFQGTVASATEYGVFVDIGKLVALLYMRFLASPDLNYTDETKFKFGKAIKRTFQKGKTIDVRIAEISKDKVHLSWDPTTENNSFLNALLRSHYSDLCIGLKGNL